MDPDNVVLSVGYKIDIEIPNESEKESSKILKSQILDIIDEDTYIIAAPFYKGSLYNLHKNAIYKVLFGYEDRGLFYFSGVIIDSGQMNLVSYFILKKVSPIHKYQRRYFYRLRRSKEIQYRKISKNSKEDDETYKKALTKDISGSGMCIVIDENIEAYEMLEVILPIDGKDIVLECRVIRNTLKYYGSTKKHEIGLVYENITEKVQYKIVKYIFTQQRLLIKEKKKIRVK